MSKNIIRVTIKSESRVVGMNIEPHLEPPIVNDIIHCHIKAYKSVNLIIDNPLVLWANTNTNI